ncbi:MAG: glycosyltransferase family protein [Planctomycetes bacterium]|nr:glycosyltransferase family protein [Planctomycetota bacterium]
MESVKIVAIVQARMGSTRLPGKALCELGRRTMLGQVVARVGRAGSLDEVVVATTDLAGDDPLARHCAALGVACFRGSAEDVLHRYWHAAREYQADVVVRVTADCPLIDPGVLDDVVRRFLAEGPDYAANVLDRTYPRGLDTEVFSVETLRRAHREAELPYQRTHVTPYVYEHPERFALLSVSGPSVSGGENPSHWRWTVDEAADLEFVRAVYAKMAPRDDFTWRDVCRLLAEEPQLAEINGHVRQKRLEEG